MKLVIRADATKEIGTGHVMRTLALAQQWIESGYGQVILAGQVDSLHLVKLLEKNGIRFCPVGLETSVESFLEGLSFDSEALWVVVDGYHFSADYISRIACNGIRVLLIDDLAEWEFYPVTAVLNGNFYARDLDYPGDQGVDLLLGSEFALLRREFIDCRLRSNDRIFPYVAKRMLLTLGGSDVKNLTPKILELLRSITNIALEVKVIIGPSATFAAKPFLDKDYPHRVDFIYGAENMAEYMEWADMAISAGGSTCLELACVGLPFIVIEVADNQRMIVNWLVTNGLSKRIEINADPMENIDKIEWLSKSGHERKRISDTLKGLVDGRGAVRVARYLRDNYGKV